MARGHAYRYRGSRRFDRPPHLHVRPLIGIHDDRNVVNLTGDGHQGLEHLPAERKFAERKPRHVATRMGEAGYEPAGDGVIDQHEHDGDGVGRLT